MNKRKIILALMGFSIMATVPMTNITVSAIGGMTFENGFKPEFATYRPSSGYINAGLWDENPEIPANNSWKKYYRSKEPVSSKSYKNYGYEIFWYEPTGYSSTFYAVKENQYAKWNPDSTWRERNTYGANYNITLSTITPHNYLDTHVETAYRYLGYNMAGEALENPFFRPDSLSPGQVSLGTSKLVTGSINDYIVHADSKPFYAVQTGTFDEDTYYPEKIKAIKRLMKVDSSLTTGKVQFQMKNNTFKNWGLSANEHIRAQQWAEVLSLRSHPVWESATFKGWSSTGYYSSAVAPASPELSAVKDLSILSITAKDSNGVVVGYGWRHSGGWSQTQYKPISAGKTYTFEYRVYNYGKDSTSITPTEIKTGFSLNNNALKSGENSKFPENDNSKNKSLSTSAKVKAKETIVLTRTETAPANLSNGWKTSAYISEKHNNVDNADVTNDTGFLRFTSIEKGDMSVEDAYYVDLDGKRTNKLIPGEDYKVVFRYRYTGPSLYENKWEQYWYIDWQGYWDWYWVDVSDTPVDLYFKGTVERFYPQSPVSTSDTKVYNFAKYNHYPKNGDVYEYESPYIKFEQPKVNVSASLSSNSGNSNSNSGNDYYSKSYSDKYDYSIQNLKIIPNSESPISDGYMTIGVMYDVSLSAPSHVAGVKEFDINTEIKLSNQTLKVKDHVKTGVTKNIVHEVQIPVNKLTSGSKNYPISVWLNSDKTKWEDDIVSQANNKASSNFVVTAPLNPTTFTNGTGCPVGSKNSNNWNLTHEISNFYGLNNTYSKFSGSKSYSFYNYNNQNGTYNSNKNYSESYKIDSVLFKSKLTTDNKYGTNKDGWVNLMGTGSLDKDKGKIKAGYGYELEINVTYKTDVFTNQPKATWNRLSSYSDGVNVSNLQTPANINNDIYVRTSDGKTLSVTGMYGTIQAFQSTVLTNNKNEVKIRYTMKTKSTNGVTEPLRIFTNENANDTNYSLNVFTPVMNGVGSSVSKSKLCDYKGLSFKIQGSMNDDDTEHIVQ